MEPFVHIIYLTIYTCVPTTRSMGCVGGANGTVPRAASAVKLDSVCGFCSRGIPKRNPLGFYFTCTSHPQSTAEAVVAPAGAIWLPQFIPCVHFLVGFHNAWHNPWQTAAEAAALVDNDTSDDQRDRERARASYTKQHTFFGGKGNTMVRSNTSHIYSNIAFESPACNCKVFRVKRILSHKMCNENVSLLRPHPVLYTWTHRVV